MVTEYILLVLTVLFVGYLLSQRRPKNFPPGPSFGFPFLGHIPLLQPDPHKVVLQWKAEYGPIIGLNFGTDRAVFISDAKLLKEATNENVFSGRPKPFLRPRFVHGEPEGIIFTEGKKWQEQRRFALRRLRDYGFGTRSMETIVQNEIQELVDRLKEDLGTPISTSGRFNIAVVNALWTIIAGERFKQDDPELKKIIKLITENIGGRSLRRLLTVFFPRFTKYLPNFLTERKQVLSVVEEPIEFLTPYIDAHLKEHDPDNPKDFIDAYINEMKSNTDPTSSFNIDNKQALVFTILDLFIAGTETTSSTLTWMFLYMARQQHVQEKLAEEIERVVGPSRLPSLADRPNMPYTEAVIHEVMRVATLAPMAVPHATTEDVVFHGYHIPKKTMVWFNLYEVHNSIEIWGDPENFRPERFLSKDGAKFERRDGFVPFSTGKRVCPGETLARDELFLFTTSLFQVFHVACDPSSPPPEYVSDRGGIFIPKPHKLVLTLRNS